MESSENGKLVLRPYDEITGFRGTHLFKEPCIQGPWTGSLDISLNSQPELNDKQLKIELGNFHVCTCHDLAVMSFFSFTPGKGYRPVKMQLGHGGDKCVFKHIVLGQVKEYWYGKDK